MSRVARATYLATLALGLSASLVPSVEGAEWSLAPTFGWTLDTASNRYLQPQGGEASQSTSLAASADLQRATETTALSFSPQLHWQLFDKEAYNRIFERDFNASASWTGERADASLTAEDADQSALTTELTETGVLSTNLHQRLDQASLAGSYNTSERYTTLAHLGDSNVSYYGDAAEGAYLDLLQGYRYPTALLGERYRLSDQADLTVSVYRNELLARLAGENTYTTGAQLEYQHTFSERDQVDASIGAARVNGQTGTQTSTTASLNASRTYALGTLALSYSRALVPYGTAVLVDRQQAALSANRGLTEKVQLTASANWVRNGAPIGVSPAGPAIVQVQTYESVQLGINWQLAETWKLGAELDAAQTRTFGLLDYPVHNWRAALTLAWTPHRIEKPY